jgi:hypothetical protein
MEACGSGQTDSLAEPHQERYIAGRAVQCGCGSSIEETNAAIIPNIASPVEAAIRWDITNTAWQTAMENARLTGVCFDDRRHT